MGLHGKVEKYFSKLRVYLVEKTKSLLLADLSEEEEVLVITCTGDFIRIIDYGWHEISDFFTEGVDLYPALLTENLSPRLLSKKEFKVLNKKFGKLTLLSDRDFVDR